MVKHISIAVALFGFVHASGCAQGSGDVDTKAIPIPDSNVVFARAAVEVGQIAIAQMPDFEASVRLMHVDERTELWLTLKELHDGLHPSNATEHELTSSTEQGLQQADTVIAEEAGCTILPCSHSAWSLTAQWCCALGENRMFYHSDILQ